MAGSVQAPTKEVLYRDFIGFYERHAYQDDLKMDDICSGITPREIVTMEKVADYTAIFYTQGLTLILQ